MTISKEKPGLWYVTCDECGDRHELETDPDDSILVAVEEVKSMRWRFNMVQERRGGRTWQHYCGDCG